jgi:CheY-like chemotaxis protein
MHPSHGAVVLSMRSVASSLQLRVPSMLNDRPRQQILLVEDYADAREMYAEYLRFSGFDVVEAANGIEALSLAGSVPPDIILMDLCLPVMDGWEATRKLKADQKTAGIPIVALTGQVLDGLTEGARKAGCDALIEKPCPPEDLVREVRRLLSRTDPVSS